MLSTVYPMNIIHRTMVVILPLCHGPSSGRGRHLAISTSPHSDVTPGLSEVSVFTYQPVVFCIV